MDADHLGVTYIKFFYNGNSKDFLAPNHLKLWQCFSLIKKQLGWSGSTRNAIYYINGEIVHGYGSIYHYYERFNKMGFRIDVVKRMSVLDAVINLKKYYTADEINEICDKAKVVARGKAREEQAILNSNEE